MISEFQKQTIRQRANDCCEYCQAQATLSHDPFSVEHILASSKGGTDDLQNLAWSCLGCNFHKHAASEGIDPFSGRMTRLFNPRTDEWVVHFWWADKFSQIIGQTAIGRATVNRLKLNRMGLVNLRSSLFQVGKHPPVF